MVAEIELSDYEKRRESRLDKFLDHIDPNIQRVLDADGEKYFRLMRLAFHWSTSFFSDEDVRKLLMQPSEENPRGYSYSMACQIFADAQIVFGDSKRLNKSALRTKMIEELEKAVQMVMMDKKTSPTIKAKTIGDLKNQIAKIAGLYNQEEDIDPEKLMPRRTIIFQTVMDGKIIEETEAIVIDDEQRSLEA